jgi:Polymer-forming cytoskeletal
MPAPNPPSMPSEDHHTIWCLHCHREQEVSRRAMSMTCKFCNKRLNLEDIAITHYEARRQIATCGVITVEKKGTAITDSIICGGLIVRGKVKGAIMSRGPVSIGPEAELKGDVRAPSLAVGAGAVLEGQYQIGPKTVETSAPPPPPPAAA